MANTSGKIWFEITTPVRQIEKEVNKAVARFFDRNIKSIGKRLNVEIPLLINIAIQSCTEMTELKSGSLRGELGLTSSQAERAVNTIGDLVARSSQVTIQPVSLGGGNRINGGISIHIQPDNFRNLRGYGVLDYYSKRYKRNVSIPWLDWLLKAGDRILVAKYYYSEGSSINSRSGLGKMKRGGSFRVSPDNAGTETNNFITRALKDKEDDIISLIFTEFHKAK